jgi:putative redox protein
MIVATIQKGSFRTLFRDGQQSAFADLPPAKGGEGRGFGPHDLLEAALASCMTITVQLQAEKLGIAIEGATCEVKIDRSIPDAVKFDYSLNIAGPITDDERKALHAAAGRCPVARTLCGTITIRENG